MGSIGHGGNYVRSNKSPDLGRRAPGSRSRAVFYSGRM